jgi:hypothetical protein
MLIMRLIMRTMLVMMTRTVVLIIKAMNPKAAMLMRGVTAMWNEMRSTLAPVPATRCALCAAPLPNLAIQDGDAYC